MLADAVLLGSPYMSDRQSRRWGSGIPTPEDQFDVKRRALIREAGKAFSKLGYHNASLTDVAKTLNVTKTALYYYVTDKNEILLECHNIALDLGDQALKEANAEPRSALEKIQLYVFRYMQLINSELGNYAVLTEPVTSLRAPERETILKRRRKHDKVLRQWVSEGIEAGDIAPGEPALIVAFMMGAINYIPTWFHPDGKVSGDEVARSFTTMISQALGQPLPGKK